MSPTYRELGSETALMGSTASISPQCICSEFFVRGDAGTHKWFIWDYPQLNMSRAFLTQPLHLEGNREVVVMVVKSSSDMCHTMNARADFTHLAGSGAIPFLSPLTLYQSFPKQDTPFSKLTFSDKEKLHS